MDGYVTKAKVNLVIDNNMTWIDAFQFGTVGDTTWSFTGQNFRLDIKGNRDQTAALLSPDLCLTAIDPDVILSDSMSERWFAQALNAHGWTGPLDAGLRRMFLHAHAMSFAWPGGSEQSFNVPLPPDLAQVLEQLGARGARVSRSGQGKAAAAKRPRQRYQR